MRNSALSHAFLCYLRQMPENNFSGAAPQFATVEYSKKTDGDYCTFCNQPIAGQYYRVNGKMACSSCADRAHRELPNDSHTAFMRGLLFGAGAAIVGLVLYAAFAIVTGLLIGYVSLAVGYIVGKGIKIGSKGMGGRRYQIAAVLLTYAAVSLAAIPIWISIVSKERKDHQQIEMKQQAADKQLAPKQDQTTSAPLSTDAQTSTQSP